MKDISVIIPIHQLATDEEKTLLTNAFANLEVCQTFYNEGKLIPIVVCPVDVAQTINEIKPECTILVNNDATDFCTQVNKGAQICATDYFSIMEFDDEYNPKWFNFVNTYTLGNEDVSVFLPINVQIDDNNGSCQFNNEAIWANQFSQEMGYIDFNCLDHFYSVNLTGGVFNKADFLAIGGLKPSIKVAFNYEFLLRLTNKKLKAFVVPKEGYKHRIFRKNSLTDIYLGEMSEEESSRWYSLAQKEYEFTEDRGNEPSEEETK